ncbi:hypothetical protein CYMTET_30516 [Cymbomonas tetramitiformis]|uniref:Uncharacterized protein n=1 Tax=Cymbomonas tetramitiformis TaxID=36881 RepID=A0AAE0KU17_9CHLO|nr:hypothetical protein CYMTET_30516 [Cymbomonas tetramitiformis]
MVMFASYCQAVESYDSDVLALRFQRYYAAGDAESTEHVCALVGQPGVCEPSAHSFAAEPSALQHFQDAAAAAAAAGPPESLSLGWVTFAAMDAPPAPAVLGSIAPPAGGGVEAGRPQSSGMEFQPAVGHLTFIRLPLVKTPESS